MEPFHPRETLDSGFRATSGVVWSAPALQQTKEQIKAEQKMTAIERFYSVIKSSPTLYR